MSTWDPELYLRFAGERTQPAVDLVARIGPWEPHRIVDLGCGPGNSTAVLRARWPSAEIFGIDNDEAMIARARSDCPDGVWRQCEISVWQPDRPIDLIFSNAALHWVPDHAKLLPQLLEFLSPGGVLAVQMPATGSSPAHRLMDELASAPEWRERLSGRGGMKSMHPPTFYYDVLRPHAASLAQWETDYLQPMDGPAGLVEWLRGTALRPFLEVLPHDDDRALFLQQFQKRLTGAYPTANDGRILVPYRRQFFIARK